MKEAINHDARKAALEGGKGKETILLQSFPRGRSPADTWFHPVRLYCQALVNLNSLLGVWSLAHTVQRPLVLGLSKHVNLHPLLEAWNSWGSYSLSDARALVNGFSVPVSGAWQGPREWSRHSGLGGPPRLGARVGKDALPLATRMET